MDLCVRHLVMWNPHISLAIYPWHVFRDVKLYWVEKNHLRKMFIRWFIVGICQGASLYLDFWISTLIPYFRYSFVTSHGQVPQSWSYDKQYCQIVYLIFIHHLSFHDYGIGHWMIGWLACSEPACISEGFELVGESADFKCLMQWSGIEPGHHWLIDWCIRLFMINSQGGPRVGWWILWYQYLVHFVGSCHYYINTGHNRHMIDQVSLNLPEFSLFTFIFWYQLF